MKSSPSKFSLTPKWPADLPDQCSKCGNPYDIRSNLEIGPGRTGRFLKKLAPWTCVIMLALLFIFLNFFIDGPRRGGGAGAFAFAIITISPALLLNIFASILPGKTRLFCHKCRHQEFHPLPKHRDNRIHTVTE